MFWLLVNFEKFCVVVFCFTGNGSGGESVYGGLFKGENLACCCYDIVTLLTSAKTDVILLRILSSLN